LKVIRGSAD